MPAFLYFFEFKYFHVHIFVVGSKIWVFIPLQNIINIIIPSPWSSDHHLAHLVLTEFPALRDNHRNFVTTCCVGMLCPECVYISFLRCQNAIITINFYSFHGSTFPRLLPELIFFYFPVRVISLPVIILYITQYHLSMDF